MTTDPLAAAAVERWRWVMLASGRRWPRGDAGHDLVRRLNNTGRRLGSRLLIVSGQRSNYEQWAAYQDYLRGGTLAAPCCGRHDLHDWPSCGRECASNHCIGRAADVQVRPAGTSDWVAVGLWHRARKQLHHHGLCLPVPGEPWHVQAGDVWRA